MIENEGNLARTGMYLLCGMGGSHLQGDILQSVDPSVGLTLWQDYGLPSWSERKLKETLIIASSYSGNTEETISAFEEAIQKGYPVAAISTGGEVLSRAKHYGVPYIQIPDTRIQPRSALGFAFKALIKMVGREDLARQAAELAQRLQARMRELEEQGKTLAEKLKGYIPVVYASNRNHSVAYNWKIKFSETGKIPAFSNVFPELNHNEMNGFDVSDSTRELCGKFHFILLKDADDQPKIQKRMEIVERLYRERKLPVTSVQLQGSSVLEKVFSSLLLADWAAYDIALHYKREPEQVAMVEEFKKLIAEK